MNSNVHLLMEFCDQVRNSVSDFCGNLDNNKRGIVFAAVRQALSNYKKPEAPAKQEKPKEVAIPATPEPKKAKKKCDGLFKPEKESECYTECKKESPENFQKCLDTFKAKVTKKVKKTEEPSGKVIVKDFWGFQEGTTTAKINSMIHKKSSTKTEIAEKLGTNSPRVAVHLSQLKKRGFVLKTKKVGDELSYRLTKEKRDEEGTE